MREFPHDTILYRRGQAPLIRQSRMSLPTARLRADAAFGGLKSASRELSEQGERRAGVGASQRQR